MTITVSNNKEKILKKISQNLGIDSQTPGTYIRTLVDGLDDFNTNNLIGINEELKELYIETASDLTVERYASKKGISRLKSKNLIVTSEDLSVSLHPKMYRNSKGVITTLYEKGESILEDTYVITFLEDVIFNSDIDRIYISCLIELNNQYSDATAKIPSGSVIPIKVPNTGSSLIESMILIINTDLFFSGSTESLDLFRRRVLSAMRTSNVSNESHLLSTLYSIPGVDQFYLDKDIYPNKVYVLNNTVYRDYEIETETRSSAIPAGSALINQNKPYGSNFELDHAERVSFTIDLKMDVSSGEIALKNLIYLKSLIREEHTLGKVQLINRETVATFLTLRDLLRPFTFSISLYFNGIRIPTEDPESILIEKHQFPFIEEITLNGEPLDVQGL